ncbi:MAG: hypothetical protein LC650_05700, partial [Actinobacteria bacterium]|nr:hypothetical protein [Actinomycetota bacterium]
YIMKVLGPVIAFFGEQFNKVSKFISEDGAMIMEAFYNIGDAFVTVFKYLHEELGVFKKIWDVVWFIVKSIVLSAWNAFKNIVAGGLNFILGIMQIFGGLFTGNWSKVWEGIKNVFKGAFQALIGIVQAVLLLPIFRLFRMGFAIIKYAFMAGWAAIRKVVASNMTSIWGVIKSVWGFIKTAFFNFLKIIWSIVKGTFTRMKQFSGNIMIRLLKSIWNTLKMLGSVFGQIFKGIWGFVKLAFSKIAGFFMNFAGNVGYLVGRIWSKLWEAFGIVAKKMIEIGKGLMGGLIKGIVGMGGELFTKAKEVVSNAVEGIKNFLGINSPSKLFESIGTDSMEGLKGGLDEGSDDVMASMDGLSGNMSDSGFGMADDAWSYGDDMGSAFDDMAFDVDDSLGMFGGSLGEADGAMQW